MTYNFTIVTALFDIGRGSWPHFRRRFEVHLANSIQLLSMDVPLVAFIDARSEPFVRYFRGNRDHITDIHVVDLTDLDYYKRYWQRIRDVMDSEEFIRDNKILNHPEGFSADYNVIMNAKVSMLSDTASRNVFNTAYFYWLDMGYAHGADVFPKYCHWAPNNIMDDSNKITYIAVNDVFIVESILQLYKQRVGPGVNGGFFGGNKKAVTAYHALYRDVFEDFLRHKMVDDDQTVAVECFLRQPALFNMVRGGWNDVFTLFH